MVAMLLRNHKRFLFLLNSALVATLLASVLYALAPVENFEVKAKNNLKNKYKKAQKNIAHPQSSSLKKYAAIYARPFRQPLVKPAPEITQKQAAAPAPIALKLIGTVIEVDHTYGIFRGSDGKEKLLGPGSEIDQAQIKAILEDSAILIYNGQDVNLEVSPKVEPPKSVHNNRKNSRTSSRRKR